MTLVDMTGSPSATYLLDAVGRLYVTGLFEVLMDWSRTATIVHVNRDHIPTAFQKICDGELCDFPK